MEDCWGLMDGEENEQMGVGQDWVCFDVEKDYGGEVVWPQSSEKQHGKKTAICRERCKASDEGADLQRPGYRI